MSQLRYSDREKAKVSGWYDIETGIKRLASFGHSWEEIIGTKIVDRENGMIYDPSMSDIDEPEAVMRRRAENEVMGKVRDADPELEALLDEEERSIRQQKQREREAFMVGEKMDRGYQTLVTFTKHFWHNGKEADFVIPTTTEGVRVEVKTVIWKGGDNGGYQGERVTMHYNFEEWEQMIAMMQVMGRTR